jgi:hypothetical protein
MFFLDFSLYHLFSDSLPFTLLFFPLFPFSYVTLVLFFLFAFLSLIFLGFVFSFFPPFLFNHSFSFFFLVPALFFSFSLNTRVFIFQHFCTISYCSPKSGKGLLVGRGWSLCLAGWPGSSWLDWRVMCEATTSWPGWR